MGHFPLGEQNRVLPFTPDPFAKPSRTVWSGDTVATAAAYREGAANQEEQHEETVLGRFVGGGVHSDYRRCSADPERDDRIADTVVFTVCSKTGHCNGMRPAWLFRHIG